MKSTIKLLATTFAMLMTAGCAEREDAQASFPGASPELISAAMDGANAEAAAAQGDSIRVDHATESKNKRVIRAAGEYWAKHPDDYAGLARAIENAGGDGVRFSFPKADLKNLTGEQAQAAYRSAGAGDSSRAAPRDVPVDAFEVGGNWYHVQDQYGEWWNFNGTWNYRDDYIGSGEPDNASGVVVEGMDEKCWRQDGDWMHAAAYDGENFSRLTYRKEIDVKSSVWGVRDSTTGFKLATDHGTHTISFKRVGDGCDEKPYGKFYWEHNQDGGGDWGFSITALVFSLSYSDSGGKTLQKSSELVYRP